MNDAPSPVPTLLINQPDFRLVRVEIGTVTEHVLEVRDGCDALGVERWRRFEVNGTALKSLFRYLVRIAEKEQA